jgi:hypothetical protein
MVSVTLSTALGASGCLSDDTSVTPGQNGLDASSPDGGVNVLDASGVVDGQGPPPADSGPPDVVVPPIEAGLPDAGVGVSILGVVAGGTTSRSTRYVLTGTAGAAHAPLLRSPNYQLVGGMAVSTQKP